MTTTAPMPVDSGTPAPRPVEPGQAFADSMAIIGRHRLILIAVPLLFGISAITVAVVKSRTYTASAAFMGSSASLPAGGLSGLASQLGFRMPTSDASQSPQFYSEYLRSRHMLAGVVEDTLHFVDLHGKPHTETGVTALKSTGASPGLRAENAMDALDLLTDVNLGVETGVVRVSVTTEDPQLSYAFVQAYLKQLNQFNLEVRQSRAVAERKFTEGRLRDAESELRESEDKVRQFRTENRAITGSPTLEMTNERLSRDVLAKQQVYNTIAQAYEQARIDEVRDTPVLTIVEPPVIPVRADRRGLLRRGILGGVLGIVVAFAIALALESRSRLRLQKAIR